MPISFGSFSGVIAFAKMAVGSLVSLFSEDPLYKRTTLNLTTTKLSGGNNNVVLDSSANNYYVAATSGLQQGTFSPWSERDGNWSAHYTGTGTSITSGLHTQIKTEELTIECWIFPTETTSAGQTLLGCMPSIVADNRLAVSLSGSYGKSVNFTYTTNSSTNAGVGSTAQFTLNEWNYISVSTTPNGNCFIGVNGTVEQFQNLNFANQTGSQGSGWGIGGSQSPYDTYYRGYISNLRVSKTALRTSNYDVPAAPLPPSDVSNPFDLQLLTYQSNNNRVNGGSVVLSTPGNKVVPFGPYNYTLTSENKHGSAFFAGDYLTVQNATPLDLSGTTWTIDGWIYPWGDYSRYNTILAKRIGSTSTTAWEVYLRTGSGVLSYYNGTNYESSVTPDAFAWNHFAAVYDGLNINLYLNGTRVLQTTVTNSEVDTPIYIGSFPSYGEYFTGNISNFRIVKGQQLYTGTSYTVPSSPTTEIPDQTSLLLNFENYSIYDDTATTDISTSGTVVANVDMSDTATGAGSILCCAEASTYGYSSYLRIRGSVDETYEFTWETWYKNLDSTNSINQLISNSVEDTGYGTDVNGFGVIPGYGFCYYSIKNNWTGYGAIYTGYTPPYNEWHHLAVSRDSSNNWRFFVDGVLYSNTIQTTNWNGYYVRPSYDDWPTLKTFYLANMRLYNGNGGYYYNDSKFKIEKLRVTRGCRYTSNFTVPTY